MTPWLFFAIGTCVTGITLLIACVMLKQHYQEKRNQQWIADIQAGWMRFPDRVERVCCICGEDIETDEKVEYCRHDICHADCYHKQVKP